MKGRISRSIAAIAVGSVLSLTGAGVAAADAVENAPDNGSGTASAAAQIEQLRTDLESAVDEADVSAVRSTADKLAVTLDELTNGQQYSMPAEAQALAAKASTDNADLRKKLATTRMASTPDPLGMLNGLLQSLLDTLSGLLDSILGSGPGLPAPPDLPEPGVPEPGVPEPGVPEPGIPPAPVP